MKTFIIGFLLISIFSYNLNAQGEREYGALQIFSNPYDMKVKIKDLKVKEKLTKEGIVLDEIKPGTYEIRFTGFGEILQGSFTVFSGDTLSVLGDVEKDTIYAIPISMIRKELAQKKQKELQRQKVYQKNNIILKKIAKEEMLKRKNSELNKIEGFYEPTDEEIGIIPGEEIKNEERYYIVEQMPKFNNGDPAIEFKRYLSENITMNEECILEGGYSIIVQFVVGADGYVKELENITNDAPLCLSKEVFRIVAGSPRWHPGYQRGKPVAVTFTFPVKFNL